MADPGYTPDPAPWPRKPDLRAFARAVRFRDRAVELAVAQHERAGLQPSSHHARATFDAIAELIREDERARLAAAGRLLPPDATTVIECEIDWVDVRSIRADAYGKAYAWPPATFDAWLAKEIEAAGQFHRAPVSMRKRTVSTFSDGSTLAGPWLPALTTEDAP